MPPLLPALLAAVLATAPLPATGRRTLDGVVRALEGDAGQRMRAAFARAGLAPTGRKLWLLALKDERRLELWADAGGGRRTRVHAWSILAASGGPGPKLREGDLQVPEGIYPIESLNPNSAYHLSLRVGYPNAADRARAAAERRTRLGGDIYIHGNAVSIGCIAIGDEGIEELFWLAAKAGRRAFTVVIVPTDLRVHPPPAPPGAPAWVPGLYRTLGAELARFVP